MKILISGAAGAIGRRLVSILLAEGHQITAVAHSMIGRAQLMHLGATAIDLDLFDPSAVRSSLAGHDALINLATHAPRSATAVFRPCAGRDTDRVQRDASAVLASGCLQAGVPRFIQESCAAVYPDCGDRWIDESVHIRPLRDDRRVGEAEAAVHRFSRAGATGVVLRFGCFYGSDAFQTTDAIRWLRKARVPISGSPDAYISSIAHDDAAQAAAAALALPAGIYNAVDDEPVTTREYFESLSRALGVVSPHFQPAWLASLSGAPGVMPDRSLRISNRKLRAACDWKPTNGSVREAWPGLLARLRALESVDSLWLPPGGSPSPCLTKPFNSSSASSSPTKTSAAGS